MQPLFGPAGAPRRAWQPLRVRRPGRPDAVLAAAVLRDAQARRAQQAALARRALQQVALHRAGRPRPARRAGRVGAARQGVPNARVPCALRVGHGRTHGRGSPAAAVGDRAAAALCGRRLVARHSVRAAGARRRARPRAQCRRGFEARARAAARGGRAGPLERVGARVRAQRQAGAAAGRNVGAGAAQRVARVAGRPHAAAARARPQSWRRRRRRRGRRRRRRRRRRGRGRRPRAGRGCAGRGRRSRQPRAAEARDAALDCARRAGASAPWQARPCAFPPVETRNTAVSARTRSPACLRVRQCFRSELQASVCVRAVASTRVRTWRRRRLALDRHAQVLLHAEQTVLLCRVSQAPVPAPPGKPESALQACLSLQGHKLHRLRGRLALQPQERARPGSPSARTLGRRCLREAQHDCARTYSQAAECTRIRSSRPGSLRRAHPSSAGPGLLPGVLHASATGRPFTTRPAARPSSSSRLARCPSSSVTARTWCVTAAKPAQQSPCMQLSSPAPARLARTACMPNVPVALRSRARVTCKRAGRSQVARASRAASSSSLQLAEVKSPHLQKR